MIEGRATGAAFGAVALAALWFGASTPAAKLLLGPTALGATSTSSLAGLLYLGAALATAPFAWRAWRARAYRAMRRASVLRLAGVVVCGGLIGPALMLEGLARAPAASVSLWLNLETVATALWGFFVFKEHLGARALGAIVLVTAASVLLTGASDASLGIAALCLAGAAVAWGLDNHLSALIDDATPAQTTFIKGVAAAAAHLGIAARVESHPWTSALMDGGAWVAVVGALAVGALAYGASIVLYVAGAQQLGAVRAQLVFSSAPLWGVALSWVVLREPVRAAQLGAAALLGVAAVLLHRERHAHAHTHDAVTHAHWHRHDDDHHAHTHDDLAAPGALAGWHHHAHTHDALTHSHAHRPDLHHRHAHDVERER